MPRLPPDMSVELHIHLYRTLLLKCPIFDYQQFTMEAVLELLQGWQSESVPSSRSFSGWLICTVTQGYFYSRPSPTFKKSRHLAP